MALINKQSTIDLVIDGQFGSTGKGKLAHYLLLNKEYQASICDFSTNAGHTVVHEGTKHVFQQLPMGAMIPGITLHLGPGCAIDPDKLQQEIDEHSCAPRVYIHPNAMVIKDYHKEQEAQGLKRVASTMKGCGAAIAEKVMRRAELAKDHPQIKHFTRGAVGRLQGLLVSGVQILGETAQGWGLSLDTNFYPYCTARNINPAAALDRFGGIHPHHLGRVFMSCRTFPIRVGNVMEDGQQKGWSGPVYSDQTELRWEELPVIVEPERTTVTGRIRRIFSWSDDMFRESLLAIRPDVVFLNFANYYGEVPEAHAGMMVRDLPIGLASHIDKMRRAIAWSGVGTRAIVLGCSAETNDMRVIHSPFAPDTLVLA